MKTDQAIYEFLTTGPEAFRALTGVALPGPHHFSSVTFKATERRVDALFEPDNLQEPSRLVEFHGQKTLVARPNLLTKMGLYGEENPGRTVRGLLIFWYKRFDLKSAAGRGRDEDWNFQVGYLREDLPEWLAREPDNPYLAVLASLVLPKRQLRQQAPRLWQTIQDAPAHPRVRETLSDILLYWFCEIFNASSSQEIMTMFNFTQAITHTRFYQDVLPWVRLRAK